MFDNSKEPFVFEEKKNNKPPNFTKRAVPRRSSAARDTPSDPSSNGLLMMAGSNIT
jgi:hypothetical protein